jgi:hypothetical protein
MPSSGATAARAHHGRLTERHVLTLGLVASGSFVLAAAIAGAWAIPTGGTSWAALHLALAGAAIVAIGTFMPHFAVTLAGTRPSPSWQRAASLSLLALGGALVVLGVTLVGGGWAAAGSAFGIAGLGWVGWHTIAPLREPLARRHPVVAAAYGTALAALAAGMILGGLGAAGLPSITSSWALVRPAHAWLTLFGGVSLTIFATLVYLAPTVLGARIRASPWLVAAVLGIGIGPIVTAAAFILDSPPAVIGGVGITAVGAGGQIGYVLDCRRRRGRFTSEHDWRAVAIGHLLAGPFWFAAAVMVVLADFVLGRALAGWSIGPLAIPLVGGWMLQELVGSWTHLVPSVTSGDPTVHARQRRLLAAAPRRRLMSWNVAVGLAWIGLGLGIVPLAVVGLALLAGSLLVAGVLLGRSLLARGEAPPDAAMHR